MAENRQNVREEPARQGPSPGTVVAAETLRSTANPPESAAPAPKGEERTPLVWRILGGTILSILALVVVTVYQQFNGALADLRASMNHLNEASADMVRKDEFNNRLTSVWNSMKDLQGLNAPVQGLREKAMLWDRQAKDAEQRRDEVNKQLEALSETVASLKERTMLQEQQARMEEEHKELVHELQQLRERLANLEGRQSGAAAAAPAAKSERMSSE